ncbi:osteoclast stimulatory transmembrane protein [Nelusetta ayraudi]|uniref:osteoclast stimulatory transmembrane protein n=1 Tax=Nelusetta ayraudi TaxID=303726 RepID=UPI003F716EA0
MKSTRENVIAVFRTGACKEAARSILAYSWDVYSMPAPAGKDVFVLMSLCLTFVVTSGGLLYHWLADTLKYHAESSLGIACVYGALMFLVSFLCHPLRCVLTMTLPTVCTKQGRKLLITAAVMILVLNVVPNITVNVGAAARLLKCTAEGFARTLLNSTEPLNRAKRDLVGESIKMDLGMGIVQNLREFDQSTNVSMSEVKDRLTMVVGSIKERVKEARDLFEWCKLLSNRIFAGLFVALLTLESSLYLKSYLTLLHFDNDYISKDLQKSVAEKNKRKGKNSPFSNRCNVTSQECTSSFVTLTLVTLHFMAITLIVVLDHVVFHVVQAILPWLLDFPATSATLSVDYKVRGSTAALCIFPQLCSPRELVSFHHDYTWTYNPEPLLCDVTTSPPSQGIRLLLGCIGLMCYVLVFLEVYARRLRRRICASFFREQERRRVDYLVKNAQEKLNGEKRNEVVSFAVGCG